MSEYHQSCNEGVNYMILQKAQHSKTVIATHCKAMIHLGQVAMAAELLQWYSKENVCAKKYIIIPWRAQMHNVINICY